MQNQRTEDPLRNACLLAGGLLAFSSIGGIVMPPLLGLPMTLVYCACIQLGIGFMLLACGWFRWTTKAMWRCLLISAVLWLANTGVFLLTFFRVLQ